MAKANFNDNDKGIKFTYMGREQKKYCDTHITYDITLPEGTTPDDALAIAVANGYKLKDKAAWYESYVSITKTRDINTAATGYRLVITHPYLD